MVRNRLLGNELVKAGLLNPDQLKQVEEQETSTGGHLVSLLIEAKLVKENQFKEFFEKQYKVPFLDLSSYKINKQVIGLIPQRVCEKNLVMPLLKQGKTLVVAFADPTNKALKEDLSFTSLCKVQAVQASPSAIEIAIKNYYEAKKSELTKTHATQGSVSDASTQTGTETRAVRERILSTMSDGESGPIVQFVNNLLAEAISKKSSDIHMEPYEKIFRIRLRIDGVLQEGPKPPPNSVASILSRIKVMAQMDIAEKRRPQDGRLKVVTQKKKEIDFRVSAVPTLFGEKIVLRVLDKSNLQVDMTKLGFENDDLKTFKDVIDQPQGLVLITGPTGSGKTTTIYSALAELNRSEVNICTAEDPVEFNLQGINQVQMNAEIGLNFASALRSFLRQDPDVMMVGEIRDYETAEVAFKAASTGHMVVSTLHTNDAPATISRLIDMGVAPYMITSTVSIVVAQRLVGKICENCKQPDPSVTPRMLVDLGIAEENLGEYDVMMGVGCDVCSNTGIKGRLAIFETMLINNEMKTVILSGASPVEVRKIAFQSGMRTLRRSALLKLKAGLTNIKEVLNSSVKDT